MSIQGNDEDKPNICNKGEVLTYQVDLSGSVTNGMCLGSIDVDSFHPPDTTLNLCHKNFRPAEGTDIEKGRVHVSLQSRAGGVDALHCSSLMDGTSGNEVSICSLSNVGSSVTSLEREEGMKSQVTFEGSSSPTASLTNERVLVADFCKSIIELASNSKYCLQEEVMLSNEITSSDLLPSSEGTSVMLETSTVGGSSQTVDSVRDAFLDDGQKHHLPRVNSCSASGNLPIPCELYLCESGLHGEQISNATLTKAGKCCQNKILDMESSERERMDIDAPELQVSIWANTAQCQIPSERRSPDLGSRSSVFNYLPIFADRPIDIPMEFAADTQSYVDGQAFLENAFEGKKYLNGKSACDDGSTVVNSISCSPCTGISKDHSVREDHPRTSKEGGLPTTDPKCTTQNLHLVNGETHERKNDLNPAFRKSYPACSSAAFTATKNVTSSARITKRRTWHRTGSASVSVTPGNKTLSSTVPLQGQLLKKISESSSTYIRKGNSLLRKASPSAAPATSHVLSPSVYHLNSLGVDEVKGVKCDGKTDFTAPPTVLKAGVSAPLERPRTPPLPSITKIPNHATGSLRDFVSSPFTETLATGCCDTVPDLIKSAETDVSNSYDKGLRVSEIPLNEATSVNNECLNELNDVNLAPSHVKRVTYVKRKSNQLVATSNVQTADKTQPFLSDSYYKRRKNQLIRTSVDNHVNQAISSPDSPAIIEGQTVPRPISDKSFSVRLSHKAVVKPMKRSKFSLVWTLHGADISKSYGNSLKRQKVLPHLFPWKRATYWRSFTPYSAFVSRNNSLSTISKKLLLLRKRDTVYTRSTHGFSLRKSKVLSVGGSNLKWSRSIERDSKKANEEATLAIAAVEKKKRERHGTRSAVSGTKKRSHSSRERIFRIGSIRYRMDSSKRTLQRIPDESSSCSAGFLLEDEAKKPYVPRRLVIGNDEYVRIGNGNQLIRDPKKRARVLASEKIRWSLHTARLRLAKKRKYCQFFTRFGECNKDDGKCPYIHDPSKIAVCTKFLNGLCSNSNCKLTHKVIPERMPDCSYFLQGLCTNTNCPYRHVHVNPNAPACEAFLRGYCADGNECRKKHSYVCPAFEATGSCPQGSKCKLHHPKNRSKGRKRKRSCAQKNARGRYFGSLHVEITEPGSVVLERHSMQEENAIFGGKLTDYIGLDDTDGEVSDGEAGESNDLGNEKTTFGEGDLSDFQFDDLDELIKPVRIMTPSDWPDKRDDFVIFSGI
ncbi:uncharacterized protein LOC110812756 isoform X2 [Carica papaya]|uniref:uncharacterized protein LOC110812756 isoform X2 n=1 Tax=Carica papaya TaxID=3649 RepID=UPI000B8C848C|nr:uncharacterized protein LOC110812756 isoform X2 [Carica papaya]